MTQGILTAGLKTMKNSKKIKKQKQKIEEAKSKDPVNVDWELCVSTVESLQVWIDELCTENYRLKKTLKEVIDRIEKDNEATKKILSGINLPNLGSTDTQDY